MGSILANIYLNEPVDQWFINIYASYTYIIEEYAEDSMFIFNKNETAARF